LNSDFFYSGAGSDHATFIYLAGVPVMDLSFGPDRKKYPNLGGYPAYHTGNKKLRKYMSHIFRRRISKVS
jgi:hypothetical protein